jgi:hypothetical protein
MDAALSVLDAVKQAKRASAILVRAEQDVGKAKLQLAAAERMAAQRSSTPPVAPTDGIGDGPAA